ncbi:hypothetical protein ACFL34_05220 [Candidatus Sumerlaeota bacterium]
MEWVNDLRGMLTADESKWRGELRVLREQQTDLAVCFRMWEFLRERLPDAREPHCGRMKAMMREIETILKARGGEDGMVAESLKRWEALKQEVEERTAQLNEAKGLLGLLVGIGTSRAIGEYRIKVTEPRPSVRVVDKAAVPPEFFTSQPDRGVMMRHIKETGQVPAGVAVKMTRPPVSINKFDPAADRVSEEPPDPPDL